MSDSSRELVLPPLAALTVPPSHELHLLRLVAAGDETAFAEIYDLYAALLRTCEQRAASYAFARYSISITPRPLDAEMARLRAQERMALICSCMVVASGMRWLISQ